MAEDWAVSGAGVGRGFSPGCIRGEVGTIIWQRNPKDYEARRCEPHPYEKMMKEVCIENEESRYCIV